MNIVIAGGGTAGWLAALFLVKSQPGKHKVTVIESSQIGIVGAGEGSTGVMFDLLSNQWFDTGTTVDRFLRETNGTPKLGILHKNWTPKGDSYYAPLDGSPTSGINPDIDFLKQFAKEGVSGMHKCTYIGQHFEQNKTPHNASFHFDARLVGEHFKSILKKDVDIIDAVIQEPVLDENASVIAVRLEDGRLIEGDFFVDCTGFKRLIAEKLQVRWLPYSLNLPVDRAIPFLLPIDEDNPPPPVTVAHALSSGWMWQIPTQTRIGCGYVYNSSCLHTEEAIQEVEKVLGREIDPIKVIDFESGRCEKLWESNCLVLGLSAAFAEPLEATSIHTTIVQLLSFCFEFLSDTKENTVSETNRQVYNRKMTRMYDDILDFLVLHYQGGRTDTELWQWITEGNTRTTFVNEVLERSQYKIPGVLNYNYYYGCIGAPLWNWILAGIGKITPEQAKKELELYGKQT